VNRQEVIGGGKEERGNDESATNVKKKKVHRNHDEIEEETFLSPWFRLY